MVSPERPTRDAYPVFRQIGTRWADNDAYGHMNNVVHYALFDTAINGWLIEKAAIDIVGGSQIGLVVETGCRYFGALAFPDLIHAGIRTTKVGTSSARYEIGLFRNDDLTPAAEGFFVHVYVDRQTHRPTPLNDRLRKVLTEVLVARPPPTASGSGPAR